MITNTRGDTALEEMRELHPTQNDAIALLEEYPAAKKDAEKASLLVKGRRLVTEGSKRSPSCSFSRADS